MKTPPVSFGYSATPRVTPYTTATTRIPQSALPQPTTPVRSPYTRPVYTVRPVTANSQGWKNQLKAMFHNRQAIIYALNLRTFAATDRNRDGKINPELRENGTFFKALSKIEELKELGVNTIHLLPLTPIGKIDHLGDHYNSPGSLYAPSAYDAINEEFGEYDPQSVRYTLNYGYQFARHLLPKPGEKLSRQHIVQIQAKILFDTLHKNQIHVMTDVPSCASVDLAKKRPDLIATDPYGNTLTPANWFDIRMLKKNDPEDSTALQDFFSGYFNLMEKLGVDGYRVDVARARTLRFWAYFLNKHPDKAWLAESYTEEDASPMVNIPRDVPEGLLTTGFDAIYGQYHIFQNYSGPEYMQYVLDNRDLLARTGKQKSLIGSFLTHDDPSSMEHGGALYNRLIAGLMLTQPDTNPYILDGFTTGYIRKHPEEEHFDIFNYKTRPTGKFPGIGKFMKTVIQLRKGNDFGPLLTHGSFVPLQVAQNKRSPQIIAFLRQFNKRTLLVVANKDVNAYHKGDIQIPGLIAGQPLQNLVPDYGLTSKFQANTDHLKVKLAPGRFYLFEIDVPQNQANNETR